MRLRIVLPVLLLGALALWAGGFFLSRAGKGRTDPTPPVAATGAPSSAETAIAAPVRKAAETPLREAPATNAAAAQHQAYVADRCAALEDLAMDDRPESLATILEELTNRDPEIRQAAINAAMQFGSRDAISKLMEAVNQTDDPDEQMALLDAVKFLKLPSLSELVEQAKTNAVAGSR